MTVEAAARPAGRPFAWKVLLWVAVGALIRIVYIEKFPTQTGTPLSVINGDGLAYHLSANQWAAGQHYMAGIGNLVPSAHHPPGWTTVIGVFAALGGESVRSQQMLNALIGIVLVVAIAYLARRIFDARTGVFAAAFAALYPGFWVLEANLLSEPLALVMMAAILAAVYRAADAPTTVNMVLVGVAVGVGALVRSELLAMLVLVVPFALRRAPGIGRKRRLASFGLIAAIVIACLLPWAAYNRGRFDEPVYLSSNLGTTLLAGNCNTYEGENLGFYDTSCSAAIGRANPGADRSKLDLLARSAAIDNMGDHLDRLPATMTARVGRTMGIYETGKTVDHVAAWHGIREWPIWLWVLSFWPLVVLAGFGVRAARRQEVWLLPLVVPIVTSLGIVLFFYGEPRYHTPADLSIVILAAAGAAAFGRRPVEDPSAAEPEAVAA